MLKLMTSDKSNSLYLGRPCYFNSSRSDMADTDCEPNFWTNARYSEEIVNSMVTALRQHLKNHPQQGVSLIGHSGGGTLAVLMAARMAEVDQVVTLAGNLDIEAWARLHHYTPLNHSLNPADLKRLYIKQLHFIGDKDNNIPPTLSKAWAKSMGQSLYILKDADHNCCWLMHWPDVLRQINQQMAP
jgi:pimeloyl-ACP methyl ester carboxylesterase